MKALLISGMQIDLGPGGGAEVPNSQGLDQIIAELITQYNLVATANFWLPVEHQMFAANHPWRKPGQPMEVGGKMTELKNFFCIQNSFGAEPMMKLNGSKIDFTAQMGTNAHQLPYSAFYDAGKSNDTGLVDFLKEREVTEIHLAGMPVETILKNTALDALDLGFEPVILTKAIAGFDEASVKEVLQYISQQGAQLSPVPDN